MKNIKETLKKMLIITTTLTTTSLFAADEVQITINGQLDKFVSIKSDKNSATIDLKSYYSEDDGSLSAGTHDIADIDTLSNSKEGYEIKVSTNNGFKLKNSEDDEIGYALRFDGADQLPVGAVLQSVSQNEAVILSVSGNDRFKDNKMKNGHLKLDNSALEDLTFNSGDFSDTVTLSIVAK